MRLPQSDAYLALLATVRGADDRDRFVDLALMLAAERIVEFWGQAFPPPPSSEII